MNNKVISTEKAPAAIGPYSQAIRSGSMIFCSGQLPLDPASMAITGSNAAEQTVQVFKNMTAVLEAAGAKLENVVKTTVFLKNMGDFAAMNEVYAQSFGSHKPARSTIEVARLPKDALVEIECIAAL